MAKFMNSVSRWMGPFVYKFYGVDIFGYFAWLNKTLNWSPEQRSAWRLNRLGDILEFCWNHVPFYREFWGDNGLSFKRPRSLEELEAYPILNREVYKVNWEHIKPDNLKNIKYIEKATGGTTHVPMRFLLDKEHWPFIQAFHLWGWGQAGYRFGDPVGIIGGFSLFPKRLKLKPRLRYIFERKLPLLAMHMDRTLAREYQARLKAFKAKYLYGYPSFLSEFASLLDEEDLRLPELKGIITTAEMLQSKYRRNIEKLGCKIWDHFGSNDGGFSSYECRLHNGFHYNDLQAILEVHRLNENNAGHLLITNLWNKSTPFIRYENGDLVRLNKSSCPCGQPFPLIKSVEGRVTEIFTFAEGKTIFGPSIVHMFSGMDEIDGFQVIQRALDKVEFRIRAPHGILPEHEALIRKVFAHHVGKQVKVDIRIVNELERTESGKLKPVWVEFAK